MSDRYSRQEAFLPIGQKGQEELSRKHALIIGAGALGSGNAELLARAGIGKLTIVDRDYVEWSNLHRQSLYDEHDAEQKLPKAVAVGNKLARINSSVQVESCVTDCTARELQDLIAKGIDLIIDATDNFETRRIINDAAYQSRIPWIFGACAGSYGMSFPFLPGKTPCLNCLAGSIPLGTGTCDTLGIIAPTVQMVISWQAVHAMKLLTGNEEAVPCSLVVFDLWTTMQNIVKVGSRKRRPDCPTCGDTPTYPYLQPMHDMKTEILCGRDTVMIRPSAPCHVGLARLEETAIKWGKSCFRNPYLISIEDGNCRFVLFEDGRALIHGTSEPTEAKSIYHRYLG